MHSPDRRYWWDGASWRLAVSADGRLWFDGKNWVPNPLRPPVRKRVPTRWTVPLQWLVIVVAVISFGMLITAAPFMISLILAMPQPMLVGPGTVTPGDVDQMARASRVFAIVSIAVEGAIAFALLVLVVVGALRRWRWAFWLALVLNGFSALGIVVSLVFAALASVGLTLRGTSGTSAMPVPQPPVALQVAGPIVTVAQALTFVGLLVAAIWIGPWACRREVAEHAPSSPQPPDREASTAA